MRKDITVKITDAIKQLEQIRKDQGLVTIDMTSLELVNYLQYLQRSHKVKELPNVVGFSTRVVVGTPGATVRFMRGNPPRPSKNKKKKPARAPQYGRTTAVEAGR